MKTNYFFSAKSISIYLIIGLISSVITSCASFKNSSYTDRDGIYGSDDNGTENRAANNSYKYKEYFSSLRDNNTQEEIFTKIDNYATTTDTLINKNNNTESYSSGYAGWGNNSQPTNVTIYNNNWGWNNYGYGTHWNYGWNWNLGWNSWYGPSIGYGWGWNNWYGANYGYYGWGYNSNYYYDNYYPYYGGYNNHNSYSIGIRGRSSGRYYNGRVSENYVSNNFSVGRRNSISNTEAIPRRVNTNPRNYVPIREEVSSPRNTNVAPRNYNPIREDTPSPRGENYTPRSYTPTRSDSSPRSESYSPPRSYSPSSNSGGGFGGGSGGGSYSGGRSGGSGGSGGRR